MRNCRIRKDFEILNMKHNDFCKKHVLLTKYLPTLICKVCWGMAKTHTYRKTWQIKKKGSLKTEIMRKG